MKRQTETRRASRSGVVSWPTRFWKDARGAFAMQFALLVAPLVICAGLAIDGGRSFLARYELESALDAAALAVGSTVGDSTALNAVARKYVDTNFKSPDTTQVVLELNPTSDIITLRGTTQLSTYFMPLVGIPKVNVSATSEVRRGGANIEVSLALDVTGSMAGSKLTSLKSAANSLIDTVVNDSQSPWFSRAAITPWANNVYAGPTSWNVNNYAPVLRGATSGVSITAGSWRSFGPATISAISWKKGGSWTVSRASWAMDTYDYAVKSSNGVRRIGSGTNKNRVQVTTSASSMSLVANDYISFQGLDGGFTGLNGNIYRVSDVSGNTFLLKDAANSSYITYTTSTTASTTGTVARCIRTPNCEWVIATSSSNTIAANDYVNIQGVISAINTPAQSPDQIATVLTTPANSFVAPGTSPSTDTSLYEVAAGSITECYTSACEYQVTTAGAHTYTSSERVYITGVTWGSGTQPSFNNSAGQTSAIESAGSNTFVIPNVYGPSYSASYTASSGSLSVCWTATCEIQITAASHGLSASDRVYITGVGGLTGGSPSVNTSGNNSWTATNVTTDTFTLSGSVGPNYTAYTSSTGTTWCLKQGCEYYRYTAADGSTQIRQISNCVTERTGANANTEAAPSTSLLGDDYPLGGNNTCVSTNGFQPLTSNKTTLHTVINGLTANGSTAGQIGVAWGWYMLSPNYGSLWPNTENRPSAYNTPRLRKVLVLMTDGEFNIAHCNGVASNDYSNGAGSNERINCNATNGAPFTNAQSICTAIKNANITIFTVGFEVGVGSTEENFLKACATDIGHYYLASNGAQLQQAFAAIATSISQLRISH